MFGELIFARTPCRLTSHPIIDGVWVDIVFQKRWVHLSLLVLKAFLYFLFSFNHQIHFIHFLSFPPSLHLLSLFIIFLYFFNIFDKTYFKGKFVHGNCITILRFSYKVFIMKCFISVSYIKFKFSIQLQILRISFFLFSLLTFSITFHITIYSLGPIKL